MLGKSVKTFIRRFVVLLLLAGGIFLPAQESESDGLRYFLTSQQKLIEGVPEDRGDSWLVKMPDRSGGFLISKLEILFVGPTRESAFEFQKGRLAPGDFLGASRLAEWGTRNQLSEQALALLKEKVAEADSETRVALRRQIDRIEYVEQLKKDARRRQANPQPPSTVRPAKDPETLRLEEFGHQVPLSVQESYVRKIQPVLLRRCALADCHGGKSTGTTFSLAKPERHALRRGNLANLEQILRRVDLTSPASSAILNHPEIVDMNNLQVYPFGEDGNSLKDYRLFSDWVLSLVKKVKPIRFTEPLSVSPEPTAETSAEPNIRRVGGVAPSSPLDLTESSEGTAEVAPGHSPKYRKLPPPSVVPDFSGPATPRIRDKFDPEPFNAKYHPDTDPLSEAPNGEPAE